MAPLVKTPTALQRDPSRSLVYREALVRELNQGFMSVKQSVLLFLVEQDDLGLASRKNIVSNARQFAFLDDARKVEAFKRFFAEQFRKYVIQRKGGVSTPWTEAYLAAAYKAAAARTFREVRRSLLDAPDEVFASLQGGFVKGLLRDAKSLARLKIVQQTFSADLEATLAQMEARIAPILSEALAADRRPPAVARAINREITEFGRLKAKMSAHISIVRASSDGQLDAFESLGQKKVGLVAEMVTRKGACPRCLKKAKAGPYTIKKARGIIPLHPWCRCGWRIAGEDE